MTSLVGGVSLIYTGRAQVFGMYVDEPIKLLSGYVLVRFISWLRLMEIISVYPYAVLQYDAHFKNYFYILASLTSLDELCKPVTLTLGT